MSIKPWEEEWAEHSSNSAAPPDRRVASGRGKGPIVLTVHGYEIALTTLVAAAPDMARALLAMREAYLGEDGADAFEEALLAAETALTKAGVPLP